MSGAVDPYRGFRFRLDLEEGGPEGGGEAAFSEASMPDRQESIGYREGGGAAGVRRLPHPAEFGNLVLKRGIARGDTLYRWWLTVAERGATRRDGTITLRDETGKPAAVWRFEGAWPSRFQAAGLDARSEETAIETLELAVETLVRES